MLTLLLACGAVASVQDPVAEPPAGKPDLAVVVYSTRGDEKVHLAAANDLSPLGSYAAGAGAHELAISPDGRWLIGSAYGGPGKGHQPPDHRLFVFDLVRRALDRVVDLGELARPNDIAFLPGSTTAIVTVEVPPHLVRIDAAGEGFTKFAIPHKAGHMLALSPDGRTAFVSHVAPGSLSFVDLESGESRANVPLPLGAEGIACTPDGRHVWVACNRSGSIAVVDAAERKVVRTLPCPGFPLRLRISPDGRTVAASCTLAGELALFSTAHPGEAARVALPDPVTDEPMRPTSIAFTPDGSAVVAVCDGPRPQLVRVDLARRAITHRLAAAGPIADALCTGRIAR